MQEITAELQNSLNSQNPCYIKKAVLFPRNIIDGKSVYGAGVDISCKIIETSSIKWKMDSQQYGMWESSNCTITLANIYNEFAPGGQYFGKSYIYKSKIVLYGGTKTDAQENALLVFEGFILDPVVYQTEDKTASVTLSGRLNTLEDLSSDDICFVTQEEELSGAGLTEIPTHNNGVKEITQVKRGFDLDSAAVIYEGYDYSVENLSQYRTPATIKLKTALEENEFLWVSYRCWYEDREMDWIAHKIADLAGDEKRKIDSVSFGGGVVNTFEEDSQNANFAGICDGTMVTDNGVTLSDEFPASLDGEWVVKEAPSGVVWTLEPDKVLIEGNTFSGTASAWSTQKNAYGTWQFEMNIGWNDERSSYYFISDSENRATATGYAFSLQRVTSGILVIRFYRANNGTLTKIAETGYEYDLPLPIWTVRIARNKTGQFRLWLRAVQNGSYYGDWSACGVICTDNTITTSSHQIVTFKTAALNNYFGAMKTSNRYSSDFTDVSPAGDYLSAVINCGEDFASWQNFESLQSVPSGASGTFYFREPGGQWQEMSAFNSVKEGLGNSLQLRWYATGKSSALPYLQQWKISWLSSSSKIGLLNFESLNCLDVMKELAVISGFEIGYERDGTFLFRKRSADISNAFVLDKYNIIEVESINDGTSYLYNNITTVFGNYSDYINPSLYGEAPPDSEDKYGRKTITVSSSCLLPEGGVDMAKTLSRSLYEKLSGAKKRAVVITRFLPQLDLGDIVKVNYHEPLIEDAHSLSLNNIYMSVEGIEFDMENWNLRLDLKEVL
ncbi:hypothetical protein Dip510_001930 [Elusimicrobium posterum]|uniref:hypothetical protein n=1 Tax=Elusimicrobium posterum TaxID=3116653 RepID=UPI003C732994